MTLMMRVTITKQTNINEQKLAEIEVTFDPPYASDMMSEAAKLELGFM